MKVGLYLNGYIPASAFVIAEVPNDVTESELLVAIQDDLCVVELEEDSGPELQGLALGEIVEDETEAQVVVVRGEDGRLAVIDGGS